VVFDVEINRNYIRM